MTTIQESIPVKGESPVAVELKYTRHGPVIFKNNQHHKAYAVRAAWREIGGAPYLASLRMDQATTSERVPRCLHLQRHALREHGVGR